MPVCINDRDISTNPSSPIFSLACPDFIFIACACPVTRASSACTFTSGRRKSELQDARGCKRRLDFKGPLLQLAHELTVCKGGALRRLHTNGDSLKRTLKWHRPLTPTSEASVLRYTRCQSALQSLTQVFLRWTVWKDGDLKRQSRSTHCAITIKPSHTNSHSDLSGLASDTICIPDALRVMSPPFPISNDNVSS